MCSIINACFIPFTEGLAPFKEFMRVGPLIMFTNALTAFGLNVAAVFLIGAAGGLVLTLAGVFKASAARYRCAPLIRTGHLAHQRKCAVLRKHNHAYPDLWSVVCRAMSAPADMVVGYALALAGLMAYKNASSK